MTTTPTAREQRYVEHTMGMPISLCLRGCHTNDATAQAAWAEAMAELHWVNLTFSTYREDSWVSRLARGEVTAEECPAAVREVIAIGERAEGESAGAFSIYRGAADSQGPGLDPTGVVKGWAVDRAAARLRHLTDTDFALSAGGDLVVRTCDPAAPGWLIGIEDPFDPSQVLAHVPVHTGGIATSGTAHRGSHLYDARTGLVPTALASVTVIARDLTTADVDATAAYALGERGLEWLRSRPGRSGLVVSADGVATPWASV